MMGISFRAALALMRRVASQPSITGSDRSIRTRSGRSRSASRIPSSPSTAVRTSYSSSRSCTRRSRLNSTSSTTRILFTRLFPRSLVAISLQHTSQFLDEVVAIECSLLNNLEDALFEHGVLGSRERFRGEHDHRDQPVLWILTKMLEDREPVHPRHEEVEQDGVGPLPGDRLERLLAVRRRLDLVGLAFEKLAHHVHHLRVVVHHEEPAVLRSDACEGSNDRVAVDRFEEVVGGAEPV